MYRPSFGIVAPPFQLTPDPTFYFDSRGHHRAQMALRGGVDDAVPFIVVSGEIGAGKTTLVRTVIADLDPEVVAVANVVSTRLDADELVEAACFAFGVPRDSARAEDADSALQRFLGSLQAQSRRAILIVDEAQHLSPAALERLRVLATHPSPSRLALQIWLVGQPELRTLLDAAEAASLRRAVGVWSHVGPIEAEETGSYIEHRLRKVAWSGAPIFDDDAFEAIHRSTLGIPRRINLLCNRLLLSQFLAGEARVDAAAVERTAQELNLELDAGLAPLGPAPAPTPPAKLDAASLRTQGPDRPPRPAAATAEPPAYLCAVGDYGDHVKAAALLRAIEAATGSPTATLLRLHDNDALAYSAALYSGLRAFDNVLTLDAPEEPDDSRNAALLEAIGDAFEHRAPRAVVVFDDTPAALACGLVARSKRIPLVHVGAGLRAGAFESPEPRPRQLVDHLADLLFTTEESASAILRREGVRSDRIHCVGALAMDSVRFALELLAASIPGHVGRPGPPRYFDDPHGYALVVISEPANIEDRESLTDLMTTLFEVSRAIPLMWPMRSRLHGQLKRYRLEPFIIRHRVRRLPAQRYLDYIRLLRHARCVLTDSWSVQEEASGLGIPCLAIGALPGRVLPGAINVPVGRNRAVALSALWEIVLGGNHQATTGMPLWDGQAGSRIAALLTEWSSLRQGSPQKAARQGASL